MAWIEPLNLEALLLSTLSGSSVVFTFLAVIFISAMAARFKMPNIVFGALLVIFLVIFSDYLGVLYLLGLLIAGFITFNTIASMFK